MLPSLINNRTGRTPSIFEDLDSFFAPIVSASSTRMLQMPVDIIETEEGYEVKAELPGFSKDLVDLEIKGKALKISATRLLESPEQKYIRHERSWNKLERVIVLPTEVDIKTARASLVAGVLTLTLNRRETGPPVSKIEIE